MGLCLAQNKTRTKLDELIDADIGGLGFGSLSLVIGWTLIAFDHMVKLMKAKARVNADKAKDVETRVKVRFVGLMLPGNTLMEVARVSRLLGQNILVFISYSECDPTDANHRMLRKNPLMNSVILILIDIVGIYLLRLFIEQ